MKLYFPELTFAASHYLPGHETCGSPHGHTYFVRNLSIDVGDMLDDIGMSIDFGRIKSYIKRWHHRNLVPTQDYEAWFKFYTMMGFKNNLLPIEYTTAEFIAETIKKELATLTGIIFPQIHFELWEGPKQAVVV